MFPEVSGRLSFNVHSENACRTPFLRQAVLAALVPVRLSHCRLQSGSSWDWHNSGQGVMTLEKHTYGKEEEGQTKAGDSAEEGEAAKAAGNPR